MFSICAAQCMTQKGLPGGRRGVEALATSPQLQTYFATAGNTAPHASALSLQSTTGHKAGDGLQDHSGMPL